MPSLANPVSGQPLRLSLIDGLVGDVNSLNNDEQQVHAPKPPQTLRARQSKRCYNITATDASVKFGHYESVYFLYVFGGLYPGGGGPVRAT